VRTHRFLVLLFAAMLAPLTSHAATTIVVTKTDDWGKGTLRAAIEDANADPSPDPVHITFAIGTGPASIAPTSALPAITRPVVIDGTTQPGFAGAPIVELRGDGVPLGESGLVLSGHDGSVIRGLRHQRLRAERQQRWQRHPDPVRIERARHRG
jgi:hypothetical protein